MSVSIHLVLATALTAAAVLVIICEAALRRRLTAYRPVQVLTLAGAAVLVPFNIFLTSPDEANGPTHHLIIAFSVAVLVAAGITCVLSRPRAERTALPRRVLAIGAHPDDLELACSGTLAKLADSGHEVHGLVMSNGAVGGDQSKRPDEAHRASEFLGLSSCTVAGFPDTALGNHMSGMIAAIEAQINRLNPDLILTHSRNDQHQDHSAVHLATLRAGRKHHSILCYESPSATAEFAPQVFIDVRDYVPTKVAAIGLHRDQSGKPYMSEQRTLALAEFRGTQARLRSAEGFEAVRLQGFQGLI